MQWFKLEAKSKGKINKNKSRRPGRYSVNKKNKSKNIIKNKDNSKNKQKNTRIIKPSTYIRRQDMSLQPLQQLQNEGYNMVTFEAGSTSCPICKRINGKTWTLIQFLSGLNHQAPLYERAHVQCLDSVRVWDDTGELPDVYVDADGNIF